MTAAKFKHCFRFKKTTKLHIIGLQKANNINSNIIRRMVEFRDLKKIVN